jgi:hypothetical protein
MLVVTDDPIIVCKLAPDVPEHDHDAGLEVGVNGVQQVDSSEKGDGFQLGLPSGSTLVRKRTLSFPRPTTKTADDAGEVSTSTSPPHDVVQELLSSVDKLLRSETADLGRSATAPVPVARVEESKDHRIPHGAAKQPSVAKLLKTFPTSIRDRANSLTDPQPLPFRWKFPPHSRFRVKDHKAYSAMRSEKNIEWYVTTGLLIEDRQGLRWAAGGFDYLLFWHDDGMPTPEGVKVGEKRLTVGPEYMRKCQKERWQADMESTPVRERPATPIVEKPDPIEDDFAPLTRVSSLPPTPSSARSLPPRCRSAMKHRRGASTPTSPLTPLFPSSTNRPESPGSGRRVTLDRRRRHRMVEVEVDEAGAAVEEEGRVVERRLEWTDSLSDNEGRTSKNMLGKT